MSTDAVPPPPQQRGALRRVVDNRALRPAAPFTSLPRPALAEAGFHRHLLPLQGVLSLSSNCRRPFILVQRNPQAACSPIRALSTSALICTGVGLNSPLTIVGALLHMGITRLTSRCCSLGGQHPPDVSHAGAAPHRPRCREDAAGDGAFNGAGGGGGHRHAAVRPVCQRTTIISGGIARRHVVVSVLVLWR